MSPVAIGARVPPGRAGRMWLRRRLATANRGREQLDRKLRILQPELQRQRIRAARSHEEWDEACERARRWTTRVALLSGQDAFRHAAAHGPATVELGWATSMGVTYPRSAELTVPADPPEVLDDAAVAPAVDASREALLAGVRAAAADEAVRRIEAEIAVTRRRLRALDDRWIPWLTQRLAALEVSLEQAEHEDGIRLRRAVAADRPGARGRPVEERSAP
jgi:V/A-type H+/Na+-transporting ATPase subunit D